MRHVIVIAVAGASLAGCSSFSLDAFKSTPPAVQVQLELRTFRRRCQDVTGAGLQDTLLGRRDRS